MALTVSFSSAMTLRLMTLCDLDVIPGFDLKGHPLMTLQLLTSRSTLVVILKVISNADLVLTLRLGSAHWISVRRAASSPSRPGGSACECVTKGMTCVSFQSFIDLCKGYLDLREFNRGVLNKKAMDIYNLQSTHLTEKKGEKSDESLYSHTMSVLSVK